MTNINWLKNIMNKQIKVDENNKKRKYKLSDLLLDNQSHYLVLTTLKLFSKFTTLFF